MSALILQTTDAHIRMQQRAWTVCQSPPSMNTLRGDHSSQSPTLLLELPTPPVRCWGLHPYSSPSPPSTPAQHHHGGTARRTNWNLSSQPSAARYTCIMWVHIFLIRVTLLGIVAYLYHVRLQADSQNHSLIQTWDQYHRSLQLHIQGLLRETYRKRWSR